MPQFFFDAVGGLAFRDLEGTNLPDLAAAKLEALRILCQLLPVGQAALLAGDGMSLVVSDHQRRRLVSITVDTRSEVLEA